MASATASYSQRTLLKNWAVSVCLASAAKTQEAKEDANATASAYMEFGKQPIEAYEPLRELADSYSKRVYGGAVQSDFNTMKCIDLMHGKELEVLATRLSKQVR
ncbi:T6SS amidase immunity protein Tai4 family protein [Roseateles sp. L2-2]|uniref:T6SS amidase immunity protein Tai4 family protein n=1 Tax=Roseateles sp. L2-2 TaxID=3422597 RepID=UPI003D36FC2E